MRKVSEIHRPRIGEGVGFAGRKGVTDIHVHIVGVGDSGNGCRVSREFRFGPYYASMLMGLRIATFEATDGRIRDAVLSAIETSSCIDRVVVLAMDGVHKNGALAETSSHVIVPNDYVIALSRGSRRVLFGASVHPYRQQRDMIQETRRCIDAGAVLFSWAPASQQINPEDERCIPFYLILAQEGIPLLCHGGMEFGSRHTAAITSRYNDMRALIRALDIGVKVIVSFGHVACAGAYPIFNYDAFEDLVSMMRSAEEHAWELYLDISSLCSPSGVRCLDRIRREMEAGTIRSGRLLYGSDFPRPVLDINKAGYGMAAGDVRPQLVRDGNLLDSVYGILKEFGVEDEVFSAAGRVLRKQK